MVTKQINIMSFYLVIGNKIEISKKIFKNEQMPLITAEEVRQGGLDKIKKEFDTSLDLLERIDKYFEENFTTFVEEACEKSENRLYFLIDILEKDADDYQEIFEGYTKETIIKHIKDKIESLGYNNVSVIIHKHFYHDDIKHLYPKYLISTSLGW